MSYHLAVLAHLERRMKYAAMQPKINHVPGQGLWPREDMRITCKNYNPKPLTVKRDTVKRSQVIAKVKSSAIVSSAKFKRPLRVEIVKREHVFNDAEKASVNATYVAMMDSLQSAQKKRLWL